MPHGSDRVHAMAENQQTFFCECTEVGKNYGVIRCLRPAFCLLHASKLLAALLSSFHTSD